jgi:hypothetical protein
LGGVAPPPPPGGGGGGGVPLYKRLEMTLSGRGKKVVRGGHREISVTQTERPLGIDAFVTELCKIRVACLCRISGELGAYAGPPRV